MGNQTPDDRKNQPGNESRTGGEDQNRQRTQPGRSGQSAAGEDQMGKQRQDAQEGDEDNAIESRTDDGGAGRERQAGGRTGQAGERMDDDDIERPGSDEKSGRDAPGSRPR
jgi:hypothetical protein